MIVVKTSKCLAILRYLIIYYSENNGKNISKNIVKLNLEQNIKSLLYNNLV